MRESSKTGKGCAENIFLGGEGQRCNKERSIILSTERVMWKRSEIFSTKLQRKK
jgi:hypothetical protein